LEIHFILSFSLCLVLPNGLIPSSTPPKPYMHLSSPPNMLHVLPISFSLFDHSNNIWWGVKITKFLIVQCFTFPSYLVPYRPKYLPSAPYNLHTVKDQVSHATDKIIVLYT
jgi:hypothetical protein